MTLKTVGSVIDDINEWSGPHGSIFYVTCFFTDGDVGSVGRKDRDAAIEVQGLLQEAVGVEQDFTLESKGQTKSGKEKFNIKGFGTPGGAATYTAPAAQGSPNAPSSLRSTVYSHDPNQQKDDSIARAVALKAAVEWSVASGTTPQGALIVADKFYEWLRRAPSVDAPPSSSTEPAGGTGDTPPQPLPGEVIWIPDGMDPSEYRGGQELGEGSCPPHQVDMRTKPQAMGRRECVKCHAWVRP